jgi:NAD(P)-dependent dehydrogenase (short-subunit alcohol dehydrogenase family)
MSGFISLAGKVAIVTGGSRGIGEAIARTFARAGAKVVVSARKAQGAEAVARSIEEAHGEGTALGVAAHNGKEEECKALVRRAIEAFGKVDVLVNNAATNPQFGPLLDLDMAVWDKMFEVNVKGYFWTSREVALHLRERGAKGSIVHVASVDGMHATPMRVVYGMTKAAILSMTKTMAFEFGALGIRVNAIAPGLVDTRLAAAIVSDDGLARHFTERSALRRVATPDEIAGAALYLASDAASFTTGHVLVADGGFLAA